MTTEILLLALTLSIFMVLMCYACVCINPREDDDGSVFELQETDMPEPLQAESGLDEARQEKS